jgi:hypothetical protein
LLCEFTGGPERAIYFVCRDLDESLNAVATRTVQQDAGSNDIRVNEVEGVVDAAIDVRFCRKIDDGIKPMLGHQCVHQIGVGDIGFEKFVTLAMFFDHAIKVGDVTGISEHIDISDVCRLVMLQNIPNKVAPDESAATGDQYTHSAR